MPTYTTLPENADLMQSKTQGYKIIPVSSDIDLGYFWQKAGGDANGKLKVTLVKLAGTTVSKLADDGSVLMVNTSPPKIKVLINPTDIDFVGKLKFYAEFKIDDSWLQADVVVVDVVDDPIPG
jgi:hypothetical protein